MALSYSRMVRSVLIEWVFELILTLSKISMPMLSQALMNLHVAFLNLDQMLQPLVHGRLPRRIKAAPST